MPVEQASINIGLDELEPHLGFRLDGPAGARIAREARGLIALIDDQRLFHGRIVYEVAPVARTDRHGVMVEGAAALGAPSLAGRFRRASHLMISACTFGPEVGEEIAAMSRANRRLAAVLLDSMAGLALMRLAERLEAAARAAARDLEVSASGRFNPGDGDLRLDDQPAVLRLAGAERIGISLTSAQMMAPRFSLSAVFGLGRGMDRVRGCASCEMCAARDRCPYGAVLTAGAKGARDDASRAA